MTEKENQHHETYFEGHKIFDIDFRNTAFNLFWGVFFIFISILIIHEVVQAGSLSSPGSPVATMYTLTDIYDFVNTNTVAVLATHPFAPSLAPAGTLHTLTEIYTTLAGLIVANKVGVGTTYLGVAGTLLANLYSGSSGAGGQADGGSDDYNNGGAPLAGRYTKGWTVCNAGNTYCGTGLTGADVKDDSTNLIWSLPCNGSSCSSFSDASPLTYSWDSSAVNNSARTALQLCSDQSGWFLPHQRQLMQAYIDGSYNNLETAGTNRNYWSATVLSSDNTYSWLTSLSQGTTSSALKTASNYLRCVRGAP